MTETVPPAPNLDALPLLAAGVGKREARFRKALDAVASYLAQGGIPNARYAEIRSPLMDGLTEAWNAGVPEALMDIARAGRDNGEMYREGTDENRAHALSYHLSMDSFGGLAVVARAEARLATAMAAPQPAALAAALAGGPALLAEIKVVAEAMGWLKERAVKRAPPGSAPPAPALPQATLDAQAAVRTRMREILADLRDRFAERVVEYVRDEADLMEKACAKVAAHRREAAEAWRAARAAGRTPENLREPNAIRNLRQVVNHHRHVGKHLADHDPNTYEVKRHADGEARAALFAKGEVERVFHLWTERNVDKLSAIVEAKGGLTMVVDSARVSSHGVETEMRVSFPDGARMGFSNAIEYATSTLGTTFLRFPARYHDVFRADGTRVRGPSEARVKQEFVPASPASPEAEPAPAGPRR